ncbi:MAG TPA: MTAP family purine nucleoside phosphorylase [Thermoleophilia bacterium]|nr:MTAP family purine nucleoside phosphorylase [Thermoleophilia bacterium]HQG02839.1 MTAP family purine nucleoside phosphorylase [Thermoleophilia bacterium]HQG55053.1 MTAP family purine nucleoside phosphorylase [Thermoleophilia bacterium]HQJ97996.1 MTAP family purine nucleoside phosphorylase [Thermoleophilia bacterium]
MMAPAAPSAGAAVPEAGFAVIGGSGSFAADFPAGLDPAVRVLGEGLVFDTPWGVSPPFALFEREGRRVLHVRMHGWRAGVSRGRASRQVFSVLHRAGVKRILSDAGVGSLDRLLDPGDLVVPDDFVDMTTDRDGLGTIVGDHLLIMRDAVCATGREALIAAARRLAPGRRLFTRGTYVVTEGPRFESPAEVRVLQTMGDIIGQSFSPEVWLARDIGACYAGVYIVVNYGEGVVRDWEHAELKRIFSADADLMGRILLEALAALPDDASCRCRELRKPTLLK